MRRLDPELAISNVQPVLEIVDDSVKAQRFSATILTVFAAVALLLAALGIYGVLANVVAQQTKDIGLRVATGQTSTGAPAPIFAFCISVGCSRSAAPGFSLLGDARAMLALEGDDGVLAVWPVRAGVAWRF